MLKFGSFLPEVREFMAHAHTIRHVFYLGAGATRQAAPVKRCEQPDRPVTTRVRGRGRTGGDGLTAYAYYRIGPLHRGKPRGSGWDRGTQGGDLINCLTHALPRCLPTTTEEADGNGYNVIAGRGGPSRPPPRASVNLVPLLLTGVRLHPPARADRQAPLPMFRCPGSPGFP